MATEFWGIIVKESAPVKEKIGPAAFVSVNQAALTNAKDGQTARLIATINGKQFVLCTLTAGKVDQFKLDLTLDSELKSVVFTVKGSGEIHVTGFKQLNLTEDDFEMIGHDEESEDEEGESSEGEEEGSDEEEEEPTNKKRPAEVAKPAAAKKAKTEGGKPQPKEQPKQQKGGEQKQKQQTPQKGQQTPPKKGDSTPNKTPTGEHKCDKCPKSFKSPQALQAHSKDKHK